MGWETDKTETLRKAGTNAQSATISKTYILKACKGQFIVLNVHVQLQPSDANFAHEWPTPAMVSYGESGSPYPRSTQVDERVCGSRMEASGNKSLQSLFMKEVIYYLQGSWP